MAPVIVPGAEWRPRNPPISTTPIGDLRWIILHTVVGTVDSSIGAGHYHIYLRGDGRYIQIQDLNLRSAASVEANPYSIAIVAEDKGPGFPAWSGSDVPDYTPAQVESLTFILGWIVGRYGLPAAAIRTSLPDTGKGCGHHRLGIDGNFPPTYPYWGRQPGGQHWSQTTGKACPGDRRITTYTTRILPALEEDELTPEERALLEKAATAADILAIYLDYVGKPTGYSNKLVAGANDAAAAKTAAQQAKAAADAAKASADAARKAAEEARDAAQGGGADPDVIATRTIDLMKTRL